MREGILAGFVRLLWCSGFCWCFVWGCVWVCFWCLWCGLLLWCVGVDIGGLMAGLVGLLFGLCGAFGALGVFLCSFGALFHCGRFLGLVFLCSWWALVGLILVPLRTGQGLPTPILYTGGNVRGYSPLPKCEKVLGKGVAITKGESGIYNIKGAI